MVATEHGVGLVKLLNLLSVGQMVLLSQLAQICLDAHWLESKREDKMALATNWTWKGHSNTTYLWSRPQTPQV